MNNNRDSNADKANQYRLRNDVPIDEPVVEVTAPAAATNSGSGTAGRDAAGAYVDHEHAILRNEDPVSGEPGFHPLGTGVGAAVGAATTGAVIGSIAGPVGALAGTIIGGVAGAIAGKAVAEEFNPTIELDYWRSEYPSRSYYDPAYPFESLQDAYRVGWESSHEHGSWEAAEQAARQRYEALSAWENEGGAVRMGWDQARDAARDAFERMKKIRASRNQ